MGHSAATWAFTLPAGIVGILILSGLKFQRRGLSAVSRIVGLMLGMQWQLAKSSGPPILMLFLRFLGPTLEAEWGCRGFQSLGTGTQGLLYGCSHSFSLSKNCCEILCFPLLTSAYPGLHLQDFIGEHAGCFKPSLGARPAPLHPVTR